MICKKCKSEIPNGSAFCMHCGKKQENTPTHRKRGNGTGSVYQLPNGKWRAEIVLGYDLIDNRVKKKTKTKSGFKTKKEALEYLTVLKNPVSSMDDRISFREVYSEWMAKHTMKVSKSTMDCYKSAYKYYKPLYYVQFAEIKTAQLQDCVDACPHGTRTKENMKALGTLLYKYALENDIVEKNYAEFIYIKREKQQRRKFFSQEERQLLWDSVGTVKNVEFVLCLMYLGFRPNEFLKLKAKDLYGDYEYFVGGSKTEAGIDRIVTISPLIKPFIVRQIKSNGDGYIFSLTGKKMGEQTFRKIYYQVLEDCGIEKKEPYCCRHTFATMMASVNAADTDKMQLMGHTTMDMTAHYTHSTLVGLKKITDNIV